MRCSILSAVAEHPEMEPADLLELAQLAQADGDGTVRAGAAEIDSVDDVHATAAYRTRVAAHLMETALTAAIEGLPRLYCTSAISM